MLELRQVPTLEKVGDIGTKCLSKQGLFLLMHEIVLVYVYIPTFEQVGADEFSQHIAQVGSKTQLKKIARALFQMSVALGLEPSGTMVAAQKCSLSDDPQVDATSSTWSSWWIVFIACVFTICLVLVRFAIKRVVRWMEKLEGRVRQNETVSATPAGTSL